MKNVTLRRFPPLEYSGAEAIRTLTSNIRFSGSDTRIIMFTSCQANEGKSFISMNVMRALTEIGKTVAFVDADLRKSVINQRYGLKYDTPNPNGLSHYLAGMCDVDDIMYKTNLAGTVYIPTGKKVMNSLTLLSSKAFPRLLQYLKDRYDYVIVDAPPVGLIIDAAEIARSCDGTILVVHHNRVTRKELISSKEQVEKSGCVVLGTVINNVPMNTAMSKKYYKKYYYSDYTSDDYDISKGTRISAADEIKKLRESASSSSNTPKK